MSDLDGPGGFNGKILMKNENTEFEIPIESFNYKHHAFFLDGKLIVHHLTKKELAEKSNYIKENIKEDFQLVLQMNTRHFMTTYLQICFLTQLKEQFGIKERLIQ